MVDDPFTQSPEGTYHCTRGYHVPAIVATALAALISMAPVLWTGGPGRDAHREHAGP